MTTTDLHANQNGKHTRAHTLHQQRRRECGCTAKYEEKSERPRGRRMFPKSFTRIPSHPFSDFWSAFSFDKKTLEIYKASEIKCRTHFIGFSSAIQIRRSVTYNSYMENTERNTMCSMYAMAFICRSPHIRTICVDAKLLTMIKVVDNKVVPEDETVSAKSRKAKHFTLPLKWKWMKDKRRILFKLRMCKRVLLYRYRKYNVFECV